MSKFTLSANSKTYNLETDGSFTEAARTGSWGVLGNGDIEIRPAGGTPEKVPVEWTFDATNHLRVGQGGAVALDFTAADPELEMELSGNVLQVWPHGPSQFKFELAFEWSADAAFKTNGKVQAKLNGSSSTVSGKADKVANRFIYIVRPTGVTAQPFKLNFVGTWKNSDQDKEGGVDVWFEYKLADKPLKFEFPKGLWKIDPSKGTLYIEYGAGLGKQRIEINGEMQIGANGHLSITFKHDVSGTTTTNTLTFATKFDIGEQKNPAELSLTIKDTSVAGGVRTIAVTGAFSYQSSNVGLKIGFTYKGSSSATVPKTVDLAMVLSVKIGTANATLEIHSNGKTTTLNLKIQDLKLSDSLSVTLGLNVTVGGKQKSVSGFLAFSW